MKALGYTSALAEEAVSVAFFPVVPSVWLGGGGEPEGSTYLKKLSSTSVFTYYLIFDNTVWYSRHIVFIEAVQYI